MNRMVMNFFLLALSVQGFGNQIPVNKTSQITWEGDKKWIGGKHDGTAKVKEGYLEIQNDVLKGGKITVDMNSLVNLDIKDPKYQQKLIKHLQSDDFFSTKKFPTAVYAIESVTPKGKDFELSGKLTIRDKTHPKKVMAKFEKTKAGYSLAGKFSFDRIPFGVTYNNESLTSIAKDKVIKNEIHVGFAVATGAN